MEKQLVLDFVTSYEPELGTFVFLKCVLLYEYILKYFLFALHLRGQLERDRREEELTPKLDLHLCMGRLLTFHLTELQHLHTT